MKMFTVILKNISANKKCIYVSCVSVRIGDLQFSYVFPMHVFIPPSLLHLKCYSRLLYNSFDFVCFVFIWKHLYLYCTLFQCDSIASSRLSTKYSLGLLVGSLWNKNKKYHKVFFTWLIWFSWASPCLWLDTSVLLPVKGAVV